MYCSSSGTNAGGTGAVEALEASLHAAEACGSVGTELLARARASLAEAPASVVREPDGPPEATQTPDQLLCVICLEAQRSQLVLPCRHLCMCGACANVLLRGEQTKTCPICRGPVWETLAVFM